MSGWGINWSRLAVLESEVLKAKRDMERKKMTETKGKEWADKAKEIVDCGDNSCYFKERGTGGMRTNGGCRCFSHPNIKQIVIARVKSFEALQAENERLQKELAELRSKLKEKEHVMDELRLNTAKAKDLEWQSRTAGLVEALRFYAKHENWEVSAIDDLCVVKTKLTKDKESFGEVENPGAASKLTLYGGKLAREALAAFRSNEPSSEVVVPRDVWEKVNDALRFYADPNNWRRSHVINGEDIVVSEWADKLKVQDCSILNCGGGRARLACKAIKDIE